MQDRESYATNICAVTRCEDVYEAGIHWIDHPTSYVTVLVVLTSDLSLKCFAYLHPDKATYLLRLVVFSQTKLIHTLSHTLSAYLRWVLAREFWPRIAALQRTCLLRHRYRASLHRLA